MRIETFKFSVYMDRVCQRILMIDQCWSWQCLTMTRASYHTVHDLYTSPYTVIGW